MTSALKTGMDELVENFKIRLEKHHLAVQAALFLELDLAIPHLLLDFFDLADHTL